MGGLSECLYDSFWPDWSLTNLTCLYFGSCQRHNIDWGCGEVLSYLNLTLSNKLTAEALFLISRVVTATPALVTWVSATPWCLTSLFSNSPVSAPGWRITVMMCVMPRLVLALTTVTSVRLS